jgi:nitrate/nitrite-specific signal transduction histidine kinase
MSDDRGRLFARGEEFLHAFSKGMEFTRELLRENERLRRRLLQIEEEQESAARNPEDWNKLRLELLQRIHTLEEEFESCRERLAQVEAENQQFAARYVEIEEENNNLANLYVASYQLHSTLDLDEVIKIVIEIVINLIGAEVFAVFLLDEPSRTFQPVAAEGARLDGFPSCALGSGAIGEAVRTGAPVCSGEPRSSDLERPIVCIPLCVQGHPIGAISIYGLLEQKDGFTPLDHELFSVLGGHAATAVFAARLHSQSERKLNTIQGFIDLLAR